jgi:hypothetical protein
VLLLEHNTITGETSWEFRNELASEFAADGLTAASMPTHMEYYVESQPLVLPHINVGAYTAMGTVCGAGAYPRCLYLYYSSGHC